MNSGKDFAESIKRMAEQRIAANREVVVQCAEHGEFTRGELINRGVYENSCPDCYVARLEAETRERRRREAVRRFEQESGVPARFQLASFENYQPQNRQAAAILARLNGYAANFAQHRAKGLSLVLCGTTGTGKTHLACSILKCLAYEQGVFGLYDTTYRAIQRVRATYRAHEESEQQAIARYVTPDLLVLDEIGVQYGTDSEKLILFSILNGRYEELRPSVLVSNLTADEIKDYLGDRVFDRMRENGGAVVAFNWSSYRQRGNGNAQG